MLLPLRKLEGFRDFERHSVSMPRGGFSHAFSFSHLVGEMAKLDSISPGGSTMFNHGTTVSR